MLLNGHNNVCRALAGRSRVALVVEAVVAVVVVVATLVVAVVEAMVAREAMVVVEGTSRVVEEAMVEEAMVDRVVAADTSRVDMAVDTKHCCAAALASSACWAYVHCFR